MTMKVKECPEPAQRRPSLGRSASKLLKRASSLGRLVSQGSSRSVGGRGSDDDCTVDYSDTDVDYKLVSLSRNIKGHIAGLKKCEAAIEKQVHSNLRLALTRFAKHNSSETPTAAYDAMRKAHKNKTMLGHTIVARMSMVDLRLEVNNAIKHGIGLSVSMKKQRMKDILSNLQYQQKQYTSLSDQRARSELKKRMINEDLDSFL